MRGKEGERNHQRERAEWTEEWKKERKKVFPLPVLKSRDDHDRTKGLFFCYHHVILDICEDGGLHEETWGDRESEREGERVYTCTCVCVQEKQTDQ